MMSAKMVLLVPATVQDGFSIAQVSTYSWEADTVQEPY